MASNQGITNQIRTLVQLSGQPFPSWSPLSCPIYGMEELNMDKKQILIVDDDPDQRLTLRLPLESAGYTLSDATSSAEGLAKVKEVKADLIVLDVMMDTATAGFRLALDLHSPDPEPDAKD